MQLRIALLFLILIPAELVAQSSIDTEIDKAERRKEDEKLWIRKNAFVETQIDILASYYQQEGNHGAVVGGTGSQELTDFTPTVIVNVPLDSLKQLTVNFGIDFYTSVSTDYIDLEVSSSSYKDSREHIDIAYTKRIPRSRITYSLLGGYSTEYDVTSFSVGGSIAKESFNGNREFGLAGRAYFDTWDLYLPIEFRTPDIADGELSDTRQSFSLALTYAQVISKRLHALFTTEGVYQTGFLSTPFHRVFFDDGIELTGSTAREIILSPKERRSETLPDSRFKLPIGVMLNYFASDLFVFRVSYRYYYDDFGITANTVGLEVPVKVTPFLSIIPFYRYHTQTASDFFAPFGQHALDEEFFTSDYDLSGFESHKAGIGVRYSPIYGLTQFKAPFSKKRKVATLKNLDFRYATYHRSDHLDANIFSFGLGFTLSRK